MRYYQKHRLKIFAKWVGDMSCLPYYITPAIWYEKYHYHNVPLSQRTELEPTYEVARISWLD